MGKKSKTPKTSASVAASKTPQQLSKKVVPLKSKRKRKFKPVQAVKGTPEDSLKKLVANVKRSKDEVSSNWQAFLASGQLPEASKSDKKKSSSVTQASIKQSSNIQSFKKINKEAITEIQEAPTIDFMSDDTYISELDPKTEAQKRELTRCIAMDCEMVGVFDGKESVLARVSLVNQHGECVYDRFVKPKEKVADYRTKVSGVRPSDLKRGEEFEVVQKEVAAILEGRILVGHALRNDMKVLLINHPPKMVRDTSRFRPFRNVTNGRTPSLKKLAEEILGVTIQTGEHSSVEDAKATMQLYNLYQKEWEEHRLQKKVFRRKNAIAAAVGQSKIQTKNKKTVKTNQTLSDEFVAF